MKRPRAHREGCLRLLLLLSFLLLPGRAAAQGITFTQIPRNLQLFARDAEDSADVVVAGTVTAAPHDSVRLEIYRNGELRQVDRAGLVYQEGSAPFQLSARVHAELSEYALRFYLDDALVASRDSLVCGDVFLINGQSNAVAPDLEYSAYGQSEWFRSFGSSYPSAGACAADTSWGLAQGHANYAHAAVGVWGLTLGLSLVDRYRVPVAILNGAVGGTEILLHLRDDANPTALDTIYGRLLWRVIEAGLPDHVRAILWHQGENDTDGPHWTAYRDRFTSLWNAWHEDFHPIEKVYVFQLHPGCGGDCQSELRDVQRTLPDSFPDLELMSTAGLEGHDGCHYGYDGYVEMAEWIFPLVARDFYGSPDTWNITPPAVLAAWFPASPHDEVRILFDGEVQWPADTLGARMKDYFYVNGSGEQATIASGRVLEDGRTVALSLAAPVMLANRVSYLPGCCYGGGGVYEGPWMRNPRGIGALSFFKFPIRTAAGVEERPERGAVRSQGSAPNPFDRMTRIRFSLASPQPVRIEIFDVAGRLVRTLADRVLPDGDQAVTWDGTDQRGNRVAPGAYVYRISTPSGSRDGRIVIAR